MRRHRPPRGCRATGKKKVHLSFSSVYSSACACLRVHQIRQVHVFTTVRYLFGVCALRRKCSNNNCVFFEVLMSSRGTINKAARVCRSINTAGLIGCDLNAVRLSVLLHRRPVKFTRWSLADGSTVTLIITVISELNQPPLPYHKQLTYPQYYHLLTC